jgi:hypothetical protein
MTENENPTSVYASFFLRGKGLDTDALTMLLKITPSYKFKEGDLYGRKKEHLREYGLWSFDSSGQVQSTDLVDHVLWVVEQLEPVQTNLASLLSQKDIHAELTVVFNLFTREWKVSLPPQLLKRIASLDILLGISIYHLSYLGEQS